MQQKLYFLFIFSSKKTKPYFIYIYEILITFILCMCAFLCVCKENSSNLQYFTYDCKQIDSNLYNNFLSKLMLLQNQAHIIFTSMLKTCHHVTRFNLFHDFFLRLSEKGKSSYMSSLQVSTILFLPIFRWRKSGNHA
jgi:uncharacterized membrane protein